MTARQYMDAPVLMPPEMNCKTVVWNLLMLVRSDENLRMVRHVMLNETGAAVYTYLKVEML